MKTSLYLSAILIASPALVCAQDTFSIEWSTVSGGGGPSPGGGVFTLDGSSIGQVAASDSGTGVPGEFSVSSGYWTFEPPDEGLVMRLDSGVVTLTWSPAPPRILQSSSNLSLWTPVTPQPAAPFFQEPAGVGRRFYRLVPAQ